MREIELELQEAKDPHFKHVYVFQHPTPKRRGLGLLLVLLLVGGGVAAAYVWRPDLLDTAYAWSRDTALRWYQQAEQAWTAYLSPPDTPPPAESSPDAVVASSAPVLAPPTSAATASAADLSSSPTDAAATPGKSAEPAPDTSNAQPAALPEPLPDSPPLPEAAPVAAPDPEAPPQAIEAMDMPGTLAETITASAAVATETTAAPEVEESAPAITATASASQKLLDEGMALAANNQLYQPAGANAVEIYKTLLSQDADAAKRLLEAIMISAYQQAQAHNEQGDFEQAEKLFEYTQAIAPQHEVLDEMRRILAETLVTQAENQINEGLLFGEQSSAFMSYQKLLQLAPSSTIGEAMRDRLLAALKEKADEQIDKKRYTTPKDNNAFDTYRLMLRIMPRNPEAEQGLSVLASKYVWLAKRQLDRNRTKQALEYVKRGLDIQPTDADLLTLQEALTGSQENPFQSLLNRATQHVAAGRLTAPPDNNAYDLYQQILQSDPTHADAQQGLRNIADVYAQQAKVDRSKGQLASSRDNVEAGLRVLPGHQELLQIRQELDSIKQ